VLPQPTSNPPNLLAPSPLCLTLLRLPQARTALRTQARHCTVVNRRQLVARLRAQVPAARARLPVAPSLGLAPHQRKPAVRPPHECQPSLGSSVSSSPWRSCRKVVWRVVMSRCIDRLNIPPSRISISNGHLRLSLIPRVYATAWTFFG
jgi:hypothetical protein